MPVRVAVRPELLQWARRRARAEVEDLARKFPKLADWEAGDAAPTLRQLEAFAHATHAPLGYLLLDAPPAEPIPIPDFRTRDARPVPEPSANLLDTIFICQERQDWYRDHLRAEGVTPLAYVGSVHVGADVVVTARAIATAIGFDLEHRRRAATWEDALRTHELALRASELAMASRYVFGVRCSSVSMADATALMRVDCSGCSSGSCRLSNACIVI